MDKAKFKRIKNKVLKLYPNAKTSVNSNGMYYLSGVGSLLDEYMIPPQKSVYNIWSVVSDTIKINQNIQRTHPNRMNLQFDEKKFERISSRNKRN
jgi:hypothetical protein